MCQFIPAFVNALQGAAAPAGASAKVVKAASLAAKATKVAAVTKGVTEIAKASVPKPPSVPTQISQPSTTTTIQTQPQGQEEDRRQMDLLSTIIAGRERKNKLG